MREIRLVAKCLLACLHGTRQLRLFLPIDIVISLCKPRKTCHDPRKVKLVFFVICSRGHPPNSDCCLCFYLPANFDRIPPGSKQNNRILNHCATLILPPYSLDIRRILNCNLCIHCREYRLPCCISRSLLYFPTPPTEFMTILNWLLNCIIDSIRSFPPWNRLLQPPRNNNNC